MLAAAPGASEQHSVWLATPEQVPPSSTGARAAAAPPAGPARHRHELHLDPGGPGDGLRIEAPWCYLGLSPARRPLLVDGHPVRCADLGQAAAVRLRGVPAPDDGLAATTVHGAPHPDEWPATLFVYGTLQPGCAAALPGRARDRPPHARHGRRPRVRHRPGLPALLPGGPDRAQATSSRCVTRRRAPAGSTATGAEYRRVRVAATASDGSTTACWTYAWTAGTAASAC